MFLKNITINNYKSIEKATASFEEGLNIVIGKNGSGKSNLLQFVHRGIDFNRIVVKSPKDMNLEYEFTICYEDDGVANELTIYTKRERVFSNGETEVSHDVKINQLANGKYNSKSITVIEKEKGRDINPDLYYFLSGYRHFTEITSVNYSAPDNSYWINKPNSFEIDPELYPDSDWSSQGFNILFKLDQNIREVFPNQKILEFENITLDDVKKIFAKAFDDLDEEYQLNYYFSKFSPIQEIRINNNVNIYNVEKKILVQNLLLDFKVNEKWLPWDHLSDGTRRLFYLISQCLSLKDGLLLIEEPELGIHPHQLFSLMTFLKEQSRDKQIIISTHSPIVLDILNPEELNRITIAKIEKNGSQFYKLNEEQKETARTYMREVGDLSYYWLHSDLENE